MNIGFTSRITFAENYDEERDALAHDWVKFSQLIDAIVDSFNSLLQLIFVIFPYAIALGLIWLVVRVVRKRR